MSYYNFLNLRLLLAFIYAIVICKSLEKFLNRVEKILDIEFENTSTQNPEIKYPILVLSNHRSLVDSLLLMIHLKHMGILWDNFGISKKNFLTKIFWDAAVKKPKNINILYLGEHKIIDSLIQVLLENKLVLFFPEGTRNTTKEWLLPFKSGADLIFKGSKPNILMYRLDNSENVFKLGQKRVKVKYSYLTNEEINSDLETIYRQQFQN